MFLPVRQLWAIFDAETRRQALVLCVLVSVVSLFDAVGVGAVLPLLKIVATPERMGDMPALVALHSWLGSPSAKDFAIVLALVTLAVFIGKNAFTLIVTAYQYRFIWDSRSRLALKLYEHYLASDYEFHMRNSGANMQRNLSLSMDEIFGGVVLPAVQITSEAVVVMAILAVLLVVDPVPTVAVMLLFGGVTYGYYMSIRNRLRVWGAEHEQTNGEILSCIAQSMRLIKDIKASGRENFFATTLGGILHRNCMARRRYQFTTATPRLLLETLAIGIMLLGIVGLLTMGRSPGEVVVTLGLFGVVAFRLMPSLNRLTGYASNLRAGSAMVGTIHADIQKVRALPGAGAVFAEPDPLSLPLHETLKVENVSYRYPGAERPALAGIDMTVRRGQSVALVGASGAGKTTLADVLLGLLEPDIGNILADGVAIRSHLRRWQRSIGYVPQDVFLLDGTIRSNVAFGIRDEEIDDERVMKAIRLAQLEKLVEGMPQGLHTVVGEKNALSGGQRQRIGIARALYNDPDVLVMDEATSALDAETEHLITQAIESLHGDKTLFIIAHRLSTVRRCDLIFLMHQGMIEDVGSFNELVERHPRFANMVKLMGMEDRGRGRA